MSTELWLAFAAASSLMLIIPGPTTLLIVSYATSQGRSTTLPLMIAVELANITALVLSLLGLGQLLATSAWAFTLVKTVGGLYLLYLGIKMLRSVSTSNTRSSGSPPNRHRAGNCFTTLIWSRRSTRKASFSSSHFYRNSLMFIYR